MPSGSTPADALPLERSAEPSPDDQAIGRRIRRVRQRRDLSLDVAAGLAGISKSYLSMLETGTKGFTRRGLIEDIAQALGCSVSDLTGQPYLAPDRQSADAMTMVPGVELAIHDCTMDDVPDIPARPIAQLANMARQANAHCDETQYTLSGRDFGAVLI